MGPATNETKVQVDRHIVKKMAKNKKIDYNFLKEIYSKTSEPLGINSKNTA